MSRHYWVRNKRRGWGCNRKAQVGNDVGTDGEEEREVVFDLRHLLA